MKALYIFVNSERPDPYLNSLVYCVLRQDVRRVVFLHIKGLVDSSSISERTEGISSRVMGAVQAQLAGLAERGEYLFTSGPRAGERVLLKTEYGESRAAQVQSYYRRCFDLAISYSNHELDYSELRARVRAIAKEKKGAYVDITSIKKRYVGDVVAAGLVEGLEGLHTFDLINARENFERPWITLIHELEQDGELSFQYANILDTAVYREAASLVVVRAPRLALAVSMTVIFLLAVAVVYWRLGPGSIWTQSIFAVSGAASILSLVFVFLAPRGR